MSQMRSFSMALACIGVISSTVILSYGGHVSILPVIFLLSFKYDFTCIALKPLFMVTFYRWAKWKIWQVLYSKQYKIRCLPFRYVCCCHIMFLIEFLIDSCDTFTHINEVYFTGTGAIIRLPRCRWSIGTGAIVKLPRCRWSNHDW